MDRPPARFLLSARGQRQGGPGPGPGPEPRRRGGPRRGQREDRIETDGMG